MNRGGVRSPGFLFTQSVAERRGSVTYGGAFTVQPFGNNLVTMTLTAQDIRTCSATVRQLLPEVGHRHADHDSSTASVHLGRLRPATPRAQCDADHQHRPTAGGRHDKCSIGETTG